MHNAEAHQILPVQSSAGPIKIAAQSTHFVLLSSKNICLVMKNGVVLRQQCNLTANPLNNGRYNCGPMASHADD
jgi:hypothetical protein